MENKSQQQQQQSNGSSFMKKFTSIFKSKITAASEKQESEAQEGRAAVVPSEKKGSSLSPLKGKVVFIKQSTVLNPKTRETSDKKRVSQISSKLGDFIESPKITIERSSTRIMKNVKRETRDIYSKERAKRLFKDKIVASAENIGSRNAQNSDVSQSLDSLSFQPVKKEFNSNASNASKQILLGDTINSQARQRMASEGKLAMGQGFTNIEGLSDSGLIEKSVSSFGSGSQRTKQTLRRVEEQEQKDITETSLIYKSKDRMKNEKPPSFMNGKSHMYSIFFFPLLNEPTSI